MYILNIGVNHETTPIEIREQMSFANKIDIANKQLFQYPHIKENIILSTCNRTEIYVIVDCIDSGYLSVKKFLEEWFNLSSDQIQSHLVLKAGIEAINHLLQVITGLHSMVLGETQILGQVRDAFLTALELKTTGKIFNEIFQRAIAFAKKAHAKTGIGGNTISISYAAVELLSQSIENMADQKIIVVGAGEMSELAIRNLVSLKCQHVTIVNRTYERAKALARQFQLNAQKLEKLPTLLLDADIVMLATGSTKPVLSSAKVEHIQKKRKYIPLTFIDIGVPRNIEESIQKIHHVTLYNIDDLRTVIDENLAARKEAAEEINKMIHEEIRGIKKWLKMLGSIPIITALHKKGQIIQQEIYESLLRKISGLSDREKNVLYYHTRSIARRLLHEPITSAKRLSYDGQLDEFLHLLMTVFGLDETYKQQSKRHTKYYQTLLQTKMNQNRDQTLEL